MTAALNAGIPGLAELLASLDVTQAANALSAMNNTLLEQALVLRVPSGVDGGRVEWRWPSGDVNWRQARLCILLEADSRLELVERFEDLGKAPLNLVLQVDLGEGASLSHARLQSGSCSQALVTRTEVRQAAGSHYGYTGIDLDGQLVRHDLRCLLQGPGARSVLRGASLLDGEAHVDNHLEIVHAARDCSSEQTFRGVLNGRSRLVFNGRVHVMPGADGAEARQSNANLLLSAQAEVDTKPELEIEADEVVASHGATVGQMDENALFYMRSRGLDEAQARAVLTGAFCRQVLDPLPQGPARELLAGALDARLGDTV
jgi:Fe-S cluster assembly protein SufD